LTPDQLRNGTPPTPETGSWWNGANKEEWKGRHLGIVQGPRNKWPALNDLVAVMNDGWDGFAGSGFGHKCFANDGQHYCWRGREIPRTVFEIAVSDGPLGPQDMRSLLASSAPSPAERTTLSTASLSEELGGTSVRSPKRRQLK
jgi:hypothetical protein